MLQHSLIRRIEASLRALSDAESLHKVLAEFDSVNLQIEDHLVGIAEGGSKIQEKAGTLHTVISSLPRITRNLSARQLFREIDRLTHRLTDALTGDQIDPAYVVVFTDQLESFAEAYNIYVAHPTGTNALPLLRVSRSVKQALSDFQGLLEFVHSVSAGEAKALSNETEFSLVLSNVNGLRDFAIKLEALQDLYAELCLLLGVSMASQPLRVGKIESGSLWTRLFGDTRVVGLMISLVESAVRYLHRNFTTEGKIAAIPKKVESLDAILDFSNRLKESGANVEELQQTLAKSAVSITNSLNELIANQPVVEVNGNILSIGHEVQRALLQHESKQKIEYTPSAESKGLPPPTEEPDGAA